MEYIDKKAYFLRNDLVRLISQIEPATERKWGKMNATQMVEHMSDALRQASGKVKYELVTPKQYIPKMQAFLMSEKPFKENTENSLLPDEPEPAKHNNITDAHNELRDEISNFFLVFDNNPNTIITNPFFGELNYEMWVQLLHKHAWHHLNQFGVESEQ